MPQYKRMKGNVLVRGDLFLTGTITRLAQPPVNVTRPTISGSSNLGSTLEVLNPGEWDPIPTGFTYQWMQTGGSEISGATSITYTTVTADENALISCVVTGTNADGSASAPSNSLGPILAPPANAVAPVVSGSITLGGVLNVTNGTWTNAPTSYGYQWLRDGTAIPGANAASYTTVAADETTMISCTVTATNAAGSVGATSNAVGPIT
ncbi:hypothetical protein SAMN05444161_3887 [Rhizobiales bacterium GAS191]|nr:hypothetical protein SAMN05444161_3887 [Rhizobiales bacterium GAS191]